MWSALQLLGEAQQRAQGLKLCCRVGAELSMEPSQVSGPGQRRSHQGREDSDRSLICHQALTLLPGPKNHPAVLTALHHPYAGAEPQLFAQFNAQFITLQPLGALQPKKISATVCVPATTH